MRADRLVLIEFADRYILRANGARLDFALVNIWIAPGFVCQCIHFLISPELRFIQVLFSQRY